MADVTKVLGENHIDISALSIADTTHFGILRLIVNDPDRAEHVLRENGFTVSSSPVLAIAVDDVPGALSEALSALHGEQGIGVDYIYAFVGKTQNRAHRHLPGGKYGDGAEVLKRAGVMVLEDEEVYSLLWPAMTKEKAADREITKSQSRWLN